MSCELGIDQKVSDITCDVRQNTDISIVPLFADNTVVLLQSSNAAVRSGVASFSAI